MGKRVTLKEKEWRIARMAALKARNVPNSECVAYAAREWGLDRRQAYKYIEWANEVTAKDWDIDRRQFTADLMAQLATLAQEARKASQYSAALGCINTMAKMAKIVK
jgi:hypothetical protein|tara:strand:+ start:153 stop:473 length:321 start_codon:yes stop_codon:yes gene_type:complete